MFNPKEGKERERGEKRNLKKVEQVSQSNKVRINPNI